MNLQIESIAEVINPAEELTPRYENVQVVKQNTNFMFDVAP